MLLSVLLLLGAQVVAQDEKEPEKSPQPPSTKAAPSTLIVLLQVKAEKGEEPVPAEIIRGNFQKVAKKLGAGDIDVRIETLEPEFYRRLQSLTATLGETRNEGSKPGQPYVRQRGTIKDKVSKKDKIEWELVVPRDKGTTFVTGVELEGPGSEKRIIRPTKFGDEQAEMMPTADGKLFILRLDENKTPKKFRVLVKHGAGKPETPLESGDWQDAERYHLVMIRNLTIERDALLKGVGNERLVANPLSDYIAGEDLTFAFASLGFQIPRPDSFDRNYYIPFLAKLEKRSVARVWMMFPLTEAEAKKKQEEYQKLSPVQLSKAIRKDGPLQATEDAVVSDKTPARWIELPTDRDKPGFSRRIRLDNARELATKYPTAHRLVVYEFQPDPTDEPEAVLLKQGSQTVQVMNEEVKKWPTGINQVAAMNTTSAKDKDKIKDKDKDTDKKPKDSGKKIDDDK